MMDEGVAVVHADFQKRGRNHWEQVPKCVSSNGINLSLPALYVLALGVIIASGKQYTISLETQMVLNTFLLVNIFKCEP